MPVLHHHGDPVFCQQLRVRNHAGVPLRAVQHHLAGLALARDRYVSDVEDFDLALTTLEVRRKLKAKVPEWYEVPELRYPFRISGEQCSSSETAFYKASVAARVGSRIADLTGGLGVDSWAFSKVAAEVLYNEMKPELAAAADRNFRELGVENVTVRNCQIEPGNVSEVLDGFEPDIIFLDPARRAEDGRKVFRHEDCQPDVLRLLPELFSAAPLVLLKLSPMADITLVCRQLGSVREVHVVAADGECKELLLLLERGYGSYTTVIYENGSILNVGAEGGIRQPSLRDPSHAPASRLWAPPSYTAEGGHGFANPTLCSNLLLFEPGKALLKAGAFDLPCRFGLEKMGRHTHLYTGQVPDELKPFGKCFEILEVLPLNNKTIKELGKRYPQASVTARNIPITSDQLRKKLGVKDGGSVHIFGLHSDAKNCNILLICSTV